MLGLAHRLPGSRVIKSTYDGHSDISLVFIPAFIRLKSEWGIKMSLRLTVLFAFLSAWAAAATPNSFTDLCADSSLSDGAKNTISIILEKTGVSGGISTANCQQALYTLEQTKKLTLAATKFKNVNYATIPLNPITDLTPVRYLFDVESLDLTIDTVNLQPLGEMKWLKKLSLQPESHVGFAGISEQEISLGILYSLTNLEELHLKLLNLVELSDVIMLKNLKVLDVTYNPIGDIWVLGQLPNLERLTLSETQVASLEGLGNHPKLVELNVASTPLGNLEGIEQAPNLKSLDASGCQHLSDLNALSSVPKLETLKIGDLAGTGSVKDLSPVQHLTQLKSLDVWQQQVYDLSPLSQLTHLETLGLGMNNIVDTTPLQNLTELKWLDLYGNNIATLVPLQGLTSMGYLRVENNKLQSLAGIANMTQLETLNATGNNINDLSELQGLTQLKVFLGGGNGFGDLSPLAGLSALTRVEIDRTYVTKVAPLANHINLQSLMIGLDPISDMQTLDSLKAPHENGLDQIISLFVY